MIGRLICLFKGHRRGKLVRADGEFNIYACPVCSREKKYKRRKQVTEQKEPK